MNYMNKKTANQNGPGSSHATSPAIGSQAVLSKLGQQILVGLLTRKQVAARWRVCAHTVARRRDLQPVRLGRRLLRYRLSDVEAIEGGTR